MTESVVRTPKISIKVEILSVSHQKSKKKSMSAEICSWGSAIALLGCGSLKKIFDEQIRNYFQMENLRNAPSKVLQASPAHAV